MRRWTALLLLAGCATPRAAAPGPGISRTLAQRRAAILKGVRYDLHFVIPREPAAPVKGRVTIRFALSDPSEPLAVDFAAAPGGHIVIPRERLRRGENEATFDFVSADRPLNRHPDFLYTLLVPGRAHHVFPCFDQPDLKARFTLSLEVPDGWTAVSNTPSAQTGNRREFAESLPIPTYLFAFAAGRFEIVTRGPMRMFHRETDPAKVRRNAPAIFDLHAKALAWLEEYTDIPYPFGKFDFVLVPSFQYNGMEHPGTIFYRASSLLLEESATLEQTLERASLIAHETAHMWFGDLVTMVWFDDVWMKEVFANFMAAKIVEPSFPEINHELRFLMAHYPAAYSVDRTGGTHPIRQELENLDEAGTLYGPIIYRKAPIAMRQLEAMVGETAFRDGVREYLRRFSFGNASWRDLIAILDARTDADLASWSRRWVEEAGRPRIESSPRALVTRGPLWKQRLRVYDGKRWTAVDLDAPTAALGGGAIALPYGYGLFELDAGSLDSLLRNLPSLPDALARGTAWVVLWETVLEGRLAPAAFVDLAMRALESERDELIVQRICSCLEHAYWRLLSDRPTIEEKIWKLIERTPAPTMKSTLFKTFRALTMSDRLRRIWDREISIEGLKFSEADEIDLAFAIAVRGDDSILGPQLARIADPDRRARFEFVMPALSRDPAVRDRFFESLREPKNRAREAWVVEALGYLHHPLRADPKHIRPALDILEEIRRTGDIFFPERWLEAALWGHRSARAAEEVRTFLRERPDIPRRLRLKVLQVADGLFRAARIAEGGR